MIAPRHSDQSPWLGGEAHVRYQQPKMPWRWLFSGESAGLALAFLAGAILGGTAAVLVWCAGRAAQEQATDSSTRRVLVWKGAKGMTKDFQRRR
jgi:hypothetical protein